MKRDQGPPEERPGSRSARFLLVPIAPARKRRPPGILPKRQPARTNRRDNPPGQTDGPEGDRPPSGVPESPDHTLAFNLPARVFLGRKGNCEPAHTSIEKISLRSKSE